MKTDTTEITAEEARAQLAARLDDARRVAERAIDTEATDPRRFDGSAEGMRINAQRWVAAGAAEWYVGMIDEGTDPIEAAREVIAEYARDFGSTARYAPQSSDWLALPRWAAHVQALAEAANGGSNFSAAVRGIVRWADKYGIDEVA